MRVDPFFSQSSLAALNQIRSQEQQLTQQLSSGVRVNALSDDPSAAAQDSQVQFQLSQGAAFLQAGATVTGRMQMVDSILGNVVTQLTQALSVAVQGNNGTLNPSNQAAVAAELTGIRDSVLGLANATYQGQALFGGSKTSSPPFQLDTSTSPATSVYIGDGEVMQEVTPSGSRIATTIPGDTIFGNAGANVLGVLNQIVSDFSSSSLPSSTATDTEALNASITQLSAIRAAFGSSMSRLQSTITYQQTQQVQLQSEEGALISADPAQTATDLKNAEVDQSAILSVLASLNQTNLFNYLK